MRWLTLLVAVLALTGCSGSHDSASDTSTTETLADAPPAYRELMARLPQLDEPASPDVTAYRLATIGAHAQQCAPRTGGAERAVFQRANRSVLALAGTVRGARLLSEVAARHRDGNGCPDDSGPATYFTTVRTYRLPPGTTSAAVFAHYERVLRYGWLETSGARSCDRRFSQGPAYLTVETCDARLTLTALGREPVLLPVAERLPARPFGLQYPSAADQRSSTELTYDVTSGETCERGSSVDVPSIIIPPPPGLRAEVRRGRARVEWSFERVLGDCPPAQILLSFASSSPGMAPFTTRVAVHQHSGTADIRLPEALRTPSLLRAATESVDGTRSRVVAVLILPQT